MAHAHRRLLRIVERGAVLDRRRVEYGDVGNVADPQFAATLEAETLRRQTGHLVDCAFQRKQAQVTRIVAQHARKRAPQPRVRRGQTGQLTAALGAAALPLFETVTPRLNLAATPAGTETNQEPNRVDRS